MTIRDSDLGWGAPVDVPFGQIPDDHDAKVARMVEETGLPRHTCEAAVASDERRTNGGRDLHAERAFLDAQTRPAPTPDDFPPSVPDPILPGDEPAAAPVRAEAVADLGIRGYDSVVVRDVEPVARYGIGRLVDMLLAGTLPALSTGSVEAPGDMTNPDLVAVAVALEEVGNIVRAGRGRALDELAARMDASATTKVATAYGTAKRAQTTPPVNQGDALEVRALLEAGVAAGVIPADVPDNVAPLVPKVSTPTLVAWTANHADKLGDDAAAKLRAVTPKRGPGRVSIDKDARLDDEAVPR